MILSQNKYWNIDLAAFGVQLKGKQTIIPFGSRLFSILSSVYFVMFFYR